MAQHDFEIDNQTAPAFRTDLNNALEALATLSSGATAPTTTYPNMLWYDSANNLLKMRTEADDAWIDIGTLNQSTNTFEVANLTELTQVQAEDDTDTTFGLVSGERLGQAVAANVTVPDTGLYTKVSDVATTSGTSVSITGLDETKSYVFFLDQVVSADGTSRELGIRFSSDNGSSYSSLHKISQNVAFIGASYAGGQVSILKPVALISSSVYNSSGFDSLQHQPLSRPSGMASTVDAVRFEWDDGASFDGGNIEVLEVS